MHTTSLAIGNPERNPLSRLSLKYLPHLIVSLLLLALLAVASYSAPIGESVQPLSHVGRNW